LQQLPENDPPEEDLAWLQARRCRALVPCQQAALALVCGKSAIKARGDPGDA